jgi:hypothetical protein
VLFQASGGPLQLHQLRFQRLQFRQIILQVPLAQ